MFAGRRVLLGRITAKQLQQQQQNNAVAATRRRRLPSTAAAPAAAPVAAVGAIRCLNVHEYISMEIMKNHGIPTPECFVAKTPEEAEHIFSRSLNRRKCNAIKNLRFLWTTFAFWKSLHDRTNLIIFATVRCFSCLKNSR